MNPEQSGPPSGDPYQFIVNPEKRPPSTKLGKLKSNNFVMKLVLIIGGAVIFMIILAVIINATFGNKTNTDDIVSLTQAETELIRVSSQNASIADPAVKNAAINTQLTMTSQLQQWEAYLSSKKHAVSDATLQAKADTTTDTKLQAAKADNSYDMTLTDIIRAQLQNYNQALQTAYTNSSDPTAKALLQRDTNQTQLLLQQWPTTRSVVTP